MFSHRKSYNFGSGEVSDIENPNMGGAGTTSTDIKYWILKNSNGKEWGDDGFFYMRKGNNTCGIETASCEYPRPVVRDCTADADSLQAGLSFKKKGQGLCSDNEQGCTSDSDVTCGQPTFGQDMVQKECTKSLQTCKDLCTRYNTGPSCMLPFPRALAPCLALFRLFFLSCSLCGRVVPEPSVSYFGWQEHTLTSMVQMVGAGQSCQGIAFAGYSTDSATAPVGGDYDRMDCASQGMSVCKM